MLFCVPRLGQVDAVHDIGQGMEESEQKLFGRMQNVRQKHAECHNDGGKSQKSHTVRRRGEFNFRERRPACRPYAARFSPAISPRGGPSVDSGSTLRVDLLQKRNALGFQ